MRKYVPALSNDDSLPSSHLSLRGSLKPAGGGPAGVALRKAEEENAAVVLVTRVLELMQYIVGEPDGRAFASTAKGREEAIVVRHY